MALPQPRTNGGEDDNRKQSTRRTVEELLVDPKMQGAFQALLPQHFTAQRMIRLSMVAITRTPKLAECHPLTLLGALIECAALGLEPNSPLQHVHLLPFWNSRLNQHEITRIIGYRGYIELGRRTGEQISIHADVAYANDKFEVSYGTNCYLRHTPLFGAGDRGEPIGAYCHVVLKDGQAFYAMPWSDVLDARKRSPSVRQGRSSPWDTDLERMARKTPIRRLYAGGEVPLSVEMAQALQVDERRMDYQSIAAIAKDSHEQIKEALGTFVVEDRDDAESDDDQGAEQEQERQQGRTTEIRTQSAAAAAEVARKAGTPHQSRNEPAGDDSRQSWKIDGKAYVQPGRVQQILIDKIGGFRNLEEVMFYEDDNDGAKFLRSLPPGNEKAVRTALAEKRRELMGDDDQQGGEGGEPAGEEGGGRRSQFNLLSQ